MYVSKVRIKNFKCFKDTFELSLDKGLNILVGDNEAGKSTILEAIHLVLSGLSGGQHLRHHLSEYLFNNESVHDFKLTGKNAPEILIEIFLEGVDISIYEGDDNSEMRKCCGLYVRIAPDEKERDLFESYIAGGNIAALPIEYYEATWSTFARDIITTKQIPIKSAFIDSTSAKYQNGSDMYIGHIIKNHLETNHRNSLIQAHRKLQANFMNDDAVKEINEMIKTVSQKFPDDRPVSLSVDLSGRNTWENGMISFVEDIPFHHIGKGHQSIIKTRLALAHKKASEANFILIEEPENHLSHSKLNQLIKSVNDIGEEKSKQILISTHSSFVANKLGLNKLILLSHKKQVKLNDLKEDTFKFFQKISGYDTLRLILCKSAILCEGDSDELIIQKAYKQATNRLPIEDGIEVMSVGLSFERYLEIANKVNKRVSVVTDNDGNSSGLEEKYKPYIQKSDSEIQIFFDNDDACTTLEPQLVKANGWKRVNQIIDQKYKINGIGFKKGEDKCKTENELLLFMQDNKTECALKFFDLPEEFIVPAYIAKAIDHVKTK